MRIIEARISLEPLGTLRIDYRERWNTENVFARVLPLHN